MSDKRVLALGLMEERFDEARQSLNPTQCARSHDLPGFFGPRITWGGRPRDVLGIIGPAAGL